MKQEKLLEKDWDILIILDACRYDLFSEHHSFKGNLISCRTRSKNTEEWYWKYWNKDHNDIILISANPHSKVTGMEENFFMSVEIGETINKEWYEPEPALDVLVDLQRQYNKKFLVHLIPPHLPYIGEKGKEFIKYLGIEIDINGTHNIYEAVENYGFHNGFFRPVDCYIENIKEACKRVNKYLSEIEGNVVVTSDHAEIVGEHGCYNHGIEINGIYNVPWMEIEK